nr:TetR family transcriptional regulator C-terminal domain-containing protein [Occultella kanbiaonis]
MVSPVHSSRCSNAIGEFGTGALEGPAVAGTGRLRGGPEEHGTAIPSPREFAVGGSRTWRDQRALHRQCVAALRGQPTTSRIEDAGLPHPDPEVEEWAGVLHTFVDGLASQLVNTPGAVGPETAKDLLRSLLHAVPPARPSN